MSGGVSEYGAVNAKVRIKYSSLLGGAGLAALSESADLGSLVDQLRHTVYGPYLESSKEKDLSPGAVESQLRYRLRSDFASILHGAPLRTRRLIALLYRRYAVRNIKAVLRAIAIGAGSDAEGLPWDRVERLLFPLISEDAVPAESMLQVGSVGAAIEMLRGSPYYEVLAGAMRRYSSEQSLFPLEVALDLHYWRDLWNGVSKLAGQDQVHAVRIIGSLVDMNNLLWAIRYRIYQRLSEEELVNYTLPFGYHVRDTDIRALAAGADVATVLARAYPGIPDAQALLEQPKKGLPRLELELKRQLARQCLTAFLGDPFHIGVALAYLVLLDLEIQDLTLLIEAKASRLAPDQFTPYLTWSNGGKT